MAAVRDHKKKMTAMDDYMFGRGKEVEEYKRELRRLMSIPNIEDLLDKFADLCYHNDTVEAGFFIREHRKELDRNIGDQSFMHVACRYGRIGMIRLLLENGAQLELARNFEKTPLRTAMESNELATMKFLVQKGANVNVLDMSGQPLLYRVTKHRDFLMRNGANPFLGKKTGACCGLDYQYLTWIFLLRRVRLSTDMMRELLRFLTK